MLRKIIILCFLLPTGTYSQEIKGFLYDSEKALDQFTIINQSQNSHTNTNNNGFFKIEVNEGDSLIFNSLEYEKYLLVVGKEDFRDTIVIELKEKMNTLKTVELIGFKNRINKKELNNDLTNLMTLDKEKNWYLYQNLSGSKGNLLNVFKLLKKNSKANKNSKNSIQKIKFLDFKNLFGHDQILNDQFISNRLNIPIKYKNLFFDYLESLEWQVGLLQENNRLLLIEKLFDSSVKFQELLEEDNEFQLK